MEFGTEQTPNSVYSICNDVIQTIIQRSTNCIDKNKTMLCINTKTNNKHTQNQYKPITNCIDTCLQYQQSKYYHLMILIRSLLSNLNICCLYSMEHTKFQLQMVTITTQNVNVIERRNQLPPIIQQNNCILMNQNALKLLHEICRNLKWVISPINMLYLLNKQPDSKCNIFMKQYNLELTQSEFIAIKLWTLSDTLTKCYHIDCANNKSVKWSLFIKALTGGIIKINEALIINTLYDHKMGIFPPIPNAIYRGTKVFGPNCKIWSNNSILSFSTSVSIASTFARCSQYKQQNQICVLKIINTKCCLLSRKLIAAPIKWLSVFSDEEEWVVLPSTRIFFVEKDLKKKIIGGAMYKLKFVD
eukprot:247669_1